MKCTATKLHLKTADVLDSALSMPVIITKYDKKTHVIISYKEFNEMKKTNKITNENKIKYENKNRY
jgi:hypothetical protein